VRGLFGQSVKDDPFCDADLRAFLGRAYNLKAIADYETGPGSEISPERAEWALNLSARFVDYATGVLPPDP